MAGVCAGISPLCMRLGQTVGGETFWRPLKTPALPCAPATPGRSHGWADVAFSPMVGSNGSMMGPRAAIWVPPMQTGVELCQDGRTLWELPPYLPQPAAANVGEGGGGIPGSLEH